MRLFPHSAVLAPDFACRPVLSPDCFAYVRLKLERGGHDDALVLWRQSQEFFEASSRLSASASPLTSYYCMLNAAKALLTVRQQVHGPFHGLSGGYSNGPVSLKGETVRPSSGGVFPALVQMYGGGTSTSQQYPLKDLLAELPFVHRSFTLTYTSSSELFIPLERARFVRKEGSNEAWFSAVMPSSYALQQLRLPSGFEQDPNITDALGIRCKRRFVWDDSALEKSLASLKAYHARLRTDVLPISTTQMTRWYLRKPTMRGVSFDLPLLGRMFGVMHRLSELSRYNPIRMERHLKAKHNWLLNEFLVQAPAQFVHLVASELTGREFVEPDAVRLPRRPS